MQDLISIVIVAFDADRYIDAAINSCLSQSYSNIELILVDDGSTDDTLAIMEKYSNSDSRVSVIKQENKGVGAARNLGNNIAKGELIAVLDADDLMLANRLEVQMQYLQQYPEIDILSCWMEYINENGKRIGVYIYPKDLTNPTQFREYLANEKPISIAHSGVIYRKEKVEQVGGYRNIRPGQDTDLWNRMVENGCIAVVMPIVLGKYRIYTSSLNTSWTVESFYAYYWLLYNSKQRKQRLEEITFEQYLSAHRKKPLMERIRLDRQVYVLFYSRKFSLSMGRKEYLAAIGHLFMAIIIDPFVIIKKLIRKLKFSLEI